MKPFILFLVVLFTGTAVFAQEDKPKSREPDQQIRVNKKYDDQGNLIGYDSSSVRSWSSDTTLTLGDMDAIRREMENFIKGGDFGNFFSDSAGISTDLFDRFRQDFHGMLKDGLPDSTFSREDTTGVVRPGSPFIFPDFDKMRERMMKEFGQFFPDDSVGESNFNFFFDPKDLDQMQKEIEKQMSPEKKSEGRQMETPDTSKGGAPI